MIKKVDCYENLKPFHKDDMFFIRIMALMKAYGFSYDFASFYEQIDDNGNVTAIISKLDGDYTLCKSDNADITELEEFFSVLGFNTVLSDDSFSMCRAFNNGVIMKTKKKAEIINPYVTIDTYPKLMELFNFNDFDTADFESWYVDVSHRIRHNSARAYTLLVNDEIVSSGILSAIYNDNAVLSSVQTSPAFRRMGYGSALVSEIICDVKGSVYLMREQDKNEEFYKKLGFENIGIWRMYK